MIQWRTLGFGALLGTIDSFALPIVKGVSQGWNPAYIVVPIVLYGATPLLFLKALEKETLTIMNLVWDLTSNVLVTLIGLILFAEKLPPLKLLGVALSFVSLFLMSYEGNGWNAYLADSYTRLVNGIFGS
jgi:multidrug transporter EmrE-like cation transporter